jgi:hypothetical protein
VIEGDAESTNASLFKVKRSLERISKEAGSMIGYHEEYRRPNLNIKPVPEVVEDNTII